MDDDGLIGQQAGLIRRRADQKEHRPECLVGEMCALGPNRKRLSSHKKDENAESEER